MSNTKILPVARTAKPAETDPTEESLTADERFATGVVAVVALAAAVFFAHVAIDYDFDVHAFFSSVTVVGLLALLSLLCGYASVIAAHGTITPPSADR